MSTCQKCGMEQPTGFGRCFGCGTAGAANNANARNHRLEITHVNHDIRSAVAETLSPLTTEPARAMKPRRRRPRKRRRLYMSAVRCQQSECEATRRAFHGCSSSS